MRGVESIALRDVSMLESAVMDLCDEFGPVDRALLYENLRDFLNKYGSLSMGSINIPESMQDLMDIMKSNSLALPHGVTMLARGLAHIEGDLVVIAPDINMFDIAASRVGETYLEDVDLKAELKTNLKRLYRSASKGIELPGLATDALKEYLKGESRTNLRLQISGPFAELVYTSVRNLVIGMCITGLLIGSAIICTTDMKPRIFGIPFLGFMGFAIASSAAGFLILRFMIIRWLKKRRIRKK
jgi:ubiquinone biosynthesis protein